MRTLFGFVIVVVVAEAILAYKRLGYNPGIYSNFTPEISLEDCSGCGICVNKCPVEAIILTTDPTNRKVAQINYERCFGCGVCARNCNKNAIQMNRREDLMYTPKDAFNRSVHIAIDNGKLQNLLFDNQHLWTHKMLQRFVGILLNLDPIKAASADRQLQSKFITFIRRLKRFRKTNL